MSEHHLVEDFTTLHADKAVVHLGLAEWLQRLRFGVGIAIECRAGHRSLCLCCCDSLRRSFRGI